MTETMFFTGFPGFLGRELLTRKLAQRPSARAVCVVQDKFLGEARAALSTMERESGISPRRVELLPGDIAAPDLGLARPEEAARGVTEVYHLAAVYDLSVPRDLAMRVNVEGTRNVLDFAERCADLKRFQYVSTCYVSGRYCGIFSEKDLEKGQTFNNFYEETKYLAEVLVRERMAQGLPATVYRPSIVVGDSRTGATAKLDGPYSLLRWLLRQRWVAVLPLIGDGSRFRFNVVPCDFVIDSLMYLSEQDHSTGKTYQLCDHAPPTCEEAVELMAQAAERRVLRVRLNPDLAKLAIERLPGVDSTLQIPPTMIDYMRHPAHYHNEATLADLAPAKLAAPSFASYIGNMARFVRENLELRRVGMA